MPLPAKPTPDSIELARSILESDNPFLEYLALIIGRVMWLNYDGVTDILNDYRGEFEAAGADELLGKIEERVDSLFLCFINEENP